MGNQRPKGRPNVYPRWTKNHTEVSVAPYRLAAHGPLLPPLQYTIGPPACGPGESGAARLSDDMLTQAGGCGRAHSTASASRPWYGRRPTGDSGAARSPAVARKALRWVHAVIVQRRVRGRVTAVFGRKKCNLEYAPGDTSRNGAVTAVGGLAWTQWKAVRLAGWSTGCADLEYTGERGV